MKYIIIKGNDALLSSTSNIASLPNETCFNPKWLKNQRQFALIGCDNTKLLLTNNFPNIDNFSYINTRSRTTKFDLKEYPLIIQAKAILSWDTEHQFCNQCGNKLSPINDNKSKICSKCNKTFFPELSPAIIVGIKKENQILMAHNAAFPEGLYSLIAGFVELGETFEQAVKREIMEEIGIKVKNITYIKSQPWPFPHSLMSGFIADYDEGEIKPDNYEILDAQWFSINQLPDFIPSETTIARYIIDYIVNENKK